MHFFPTALLSLSLSLMACDSDTSATSETNDESANSMTETTSTNESAATADEPATATPAGYQPDQTAPKPGQYQLLGIKDPDLNMMAAAVKIPRGWLAKQSFSRRWRGAAPVNQIYFVFRSPDSKQQIEYFPLSDYVYIDGPGRQQYRQQAQSMGIDPRVAENEVPPMTALTYIKQVLLPQLAQQGVELRNVNNPREVAPHPDTTPGSGRPITSSSASVDGVLPNGNKARVEVRLSMAKHQNGSEVAYGWWATPSLTQTANGDLAATYVHTKTAIESLVMNPAWVKKDGELQQRGYQANSQMIQRNHEASMANIAQWGRVNAANAKANMDIINSNAAESRARSEQSKADYNERMAQNDRKAELVADVLINNETKYQNTTTGERIKVENRYNHVYTNNNGAYYLTNTPLKANEINWQEMEKVPFNDY